MASTSDWQTRLAAIEEMMREMSAQSDPQQMVQQYAARVRELTPSARTLAVSRRGLEQPWYRITRSTLWKEAINPWTQKDRLPLLDRGLLGEWIYSGQTRVIDDLEVPEDDPAHEHLGGFRSAVVLPQWDRGECLNMVVLLREARGAWDAQRVPDMVWQANLFGRSTHNLVLARDLQGAYESIERELKVVADIQRSLLPAELPDVPNLRLAAHYETSRQAGGDYYDFFPLPGGRWGILIADVSGHGTPAAVIMAILHAIAHSFPCGASMECQTPSWEPSPAQMLTYLNRSLTVRYTLDGGTFATAFYAVYDPATRRLRYSSAGHNPPRVARCGGSVVSLDQAQRLPLGIIAGEEYAEAVVGLSRGDQLVLYTDGITEGRNPEGEMFGVERLDEAIQRFCPCSGAPDSARAAADELLAELKRFTRGRPADDDRTLVVATAG